MSREPRDAPQFYLTAPSPCPYLPRRDERKVFTHLIGKRAAALNDTLTQSGFRRSQTIAYRPACENCRACVSVRVKVDEFVPSRNLRRIAERNAELRGTVVRAEPTSEQYSLFRGYLDAWGDRDAFAISHVGWGLNERARYEAMAMSGRRDFNGTEARAVAGNFLFSTGANEFAGRHTAGHFDLPVMGTTITLDGEAVVRDGALA